jgi:hypothetical protein
VCVCVCVYVDFLRIFFFFQVLSSKADFHHYKSVVDYEYKDGRNKNQVTRLILGINNWFYNHRLSRIPNPPPCQEQDWAIQLKLSSSTFKGPQSDIHHSTEGHEIIFDRHGLTMSYTAFCNLMNSNELQQLLQQVTAQSSLHSPSKKRSLTVIPTSRLAPTFANNNNQQQVNLESDENDGDDDDNDQSTPSIVAESSPILPPPVQSKVLKTRRRLDFSPEPDAPTTNHIPPDNSGPPRAGGTKKRKSEHSSVAGLRFHAGDTNTGPTTTNKHVVQ